MAVSYNTRRARITAGAGAIIAAGALAAGFAGQPAEGYADEAEPEYTTVNDGDASTVDSISYSNVSTPADNNGEQQDETGEQGSASTCLTLSVPGSYDTSAAQALLDRVNEIRAEAASEGLTDYATGEAVTGAPLSWSTGLEHAAQVRAAEASLDFSHERPDGSGTVLGADGPFASEGTVVEAENLVQGSDAASALELWYAEKDAYERYLGGDTTLTEADFGHYAALISDRYTFIGLGSFTDANGATSLAAEFSDADSSSDELHPDGDYTAQVNVQETNLTAAITTPQDWNGTLTVGETLQLGATLASAQGIACEPASPLVWASSDESVITVDGNGLASAVGAGSATISVSAGDGSDALATLDLAVEAAQVAVPDVSNLTAKDAQTSLEAAGLQVAVDTGDEAPDPSLDGIVYAQSPDAGALVDTGAQVALTVYADYVAPQATDLDEPEPVETEAGVAPELPETVTVYWNDGSSTQEHVTWDAIDATQYAESGSFTVEGTVGDTGLTAEIEVNVHEKPAPAIDALEDVDVSTSSGTAPVLPETVTAAMSDGTTQPVDVVWDAVNPAQYSTREGGAFDVTGTVEGAAGHVVAHVTVEAASIVSLENPSPISTFVGHEPDLPATVKATWSNGDATDEPVTWQPLAGLTQDGKGTWDFPGDVTLTGTVEETDLTASIAVTVVQPSVQSIGKPDDVTTQAGVAPKLPETVEVTWDDGSATQETIDWDEINSRDYAQAGSFTATGTVPTANDAQISVQVSVQATPTIAGVSPIEDVTTPSGTEPTLPSKAEVTWSDGTTGTGDIAWDAIDPAQYSMREGGTFNVHGTLSATYGTGDEAVTDSVDVSKTVTVTPATATSVAQPTGVTTRAKTAPTLPATARVTWSNGDVTDEAVSWDALDAASYAKAGTFIVNGQVDATGQSVTCTVTIEGPTAVSVKAADATTVAGIAPQLPATVDVTWDDGTVTQEAVVWDSVSHDSYAQAGTFDVAGTIPSATGVTAVAHVSVTAASAVRAVVENSVVTTTAGKAPTLPASAKVTWSNGNVTDEAVAWNVVDTSLYAQAGSFDVQGMAAGLTVTAHVNVTAAEVVKTADTSPSPALLAMLASGGLLAALAGLILRLQVKRR